MGNLCSCASNREKDNKITKENIKNNIMDSINKIIKEPLKKTHIVLDSINKIDDEYIFV
jgi:hypothetical protein